MPKPKEYPRILKRPQRLEFIEAWGSKEVVRAYAEDRNGGVLFEGKFCISWTDWDLLTMWVEKRRRGEA